MRLETRLFVRGYWVVGQEQAAIATDTKYNLQSSWPLLDLRHHVFDCGTSSMNHYLTGTTKALLERL